MKVATLAIMAGILLAGTGAASAKSCYALWYERNQIYDDNGFCFKTKLGKQTFDNSDCYTSNPQFSYWEQKRISKIRREERRKGCKVN